MQKISFQDIQTAFAHRSDKDLQKAKWLFRSFDYPILLKWGPGLAKIAVNTGFKWTIKNTIFEHFCGGETIEECKLAIQKLSKNHIGTILDYSVEGEENETVFIATQKEIIKTIEIAKNNPSIPFAVFKVTGIIHGELLEKVSSNTELSEVENQQWEAGKKRFFEICHTAYNNEVRLFVDAEESWIQPAIDDLAEQAMIQFNAKQAIIYNTIQLYRHDRLDYLRNQILNNSHFLGFKLVRGAYMEKERQRAKDLGYLDPIQPNKESTDKDFNLALKLCIENCDKVSVCAGTHNEESSMNGVSWMNDKNLESSDKRVFFSQLLGMSDHISYNLANANYNVAKYVPYGPVLAVIPYLTRRAQENSGMAGQMGRELSLINQELLRRKSNA